MPLSQFCMTNKSIQHLVRVTKGSSASLSPWQYRIVPQKHLGWERIISVTLLTYSPSASYWCSFCLERLLKSARNGELQGTENLSFNCWKGFQQAGARGDVPWAKWSLHIWSNTCVLQSSRTCFFPAAHPRKHNNPKHTVCQISGVGIRLPDPSNSWQCSAGCVGGWTINLLARKNTAGLFSTTNPPLRCQQGMLEQGGWEEHQNPLVWAEGVCPSSKHEQWMKQWLPKLQGWEQYGTVHHHSPQMGQRRLLQNIYQAWNRIRKGQKNQLTFFFLLATYNSDSSVKFWHFLAFTCHLKKATTNKKNPRKPT